MGEWVSMEGDDPIVGDVVRWTETVYAPRKSRSGKAQRRGLRSMAAEVIAEPNDKGFLGLLVRRSEILEEYAIRKPPHVTNGTEVKRALKALRRGGLERLLWSDESARSIVTAGDQLKN